MSFFTAIRQYLARPRVRPWALAAPVLVLLVALPLLRPLRHPDPANISDEESAHLATIAAIAEHHTLALDSLDVSSPLAALPERGLVLYHGRTFSDQPPVMAALLAVPYWVMFKLHMTMANSSVLTAYLLTLLGVTLPVAVAAGLIYKMTRIFELPRSWRAGLAAAVVFGGGLISYAVVLNAHAPAATLVLATAGCLVYMAASRNPGRHLGWLMAGGFCAALAAALDPPALAFLLPLMLVILAMRWPPARRMLGVGLFALGAIVPLSLHLVLNHRITGDWKPGFWHPELQVTRSGAPLGSRARWIITPVNSAISDEDEDTVVSGWRSAWRAVYRLTGCLLGSHGLLSHFPVLIFAGMGIATVLRRHWPASTKALAIVSAGCAGLLVLICAFHAVDTHSAIFVSPLFVVLLPLALFWSGGWIRRPHPPAVWITAGVLLGFSVIISLMGAVLA